MESENMKKVREAMAQAQTQALTDRVGLAGQLEEAVHIDFTSPSGQRYQGQVVFRRPTVRDYMRIGALTAEELRLSGVQNLELLDVTTRVIARALGTLPVVVTKAPSWLLNNGRIDFSHITDVDLILHLYAKYGEWEESFRIPSETALGGNGEISPTA